jgi:hypothetical protein
MGLGISVSAIWCKVHNKRSFNYKKTLHASERDTEKNKTRRSVFIDGKKDLPTEHLVFLDESGVTTNMTRRYGRAIGQERCQDSAPVNREKKTTIISTTRLDGVWRHKP